MSDPVPVPSVVAPPFPSIAADERMLEATAVKVRANIVADFKALAAKVGKTVAYLLVAAGLVFVGHVL